MHQETVSFSCREAVSSCSLRTGFPTDCPGGCPPARGLWLPARPSNPTLHLGNGLKIPTSCHGAPQMAVHLGPQVPGPQGLALDVPTWRAALEPPAHLAGSCKAGSSLEQPPARVHAEKRWRCQTDVRNLIPGEFAHAGRRAQRRRKASHLDAT